MRLKKQAERDKTVSDKLAIASKYHRAFEQKVLVLGSPNSGKTTLINVIMNNFGGQYPKDIPHPVCDLPYSITNFIIKCIIFCYGMLKFKSKNHELLMEQFGGLDQEIRKAIKERKITKPLLKFVKFVGENEDEFLGWAANNVRYLNNIKYFFSESSIDRLEFPEKFTIEDFIRIKMPRTSCAISEFIFESYGNHHILIDTGGMRGEPRKWINQFDYYVTQVVYLISLTDYILFEEVNNLNLLSMAMWTFQEFLGHGISNVVLYFTKPDQFEKLLETHPFSNYFPGYSGSNELHPIIRYLIDDVLRVNEVDHLGRYCLNYGKQDILLTIRPINLCNQDQVTTDFYNLMSLELRTVV